MSRSRLLRKTSVAGLAAAFLLGGLAPVVAGGLVSAAGGACVESGQGVEARVADPHANEPKLFPDNEAKAYGALPDAATLPAGSVTVPTVFNFISDHQLTRAERTRWARMISDQMAVLNDSFSGGTAADAADTPFRFDVTKVKWTVDADWATVVPGKGERDMKAALYEGTSETLNVYAADIGAGLLGWAYFPKGYNAGRDYIDGVVILDESMPGGTAGTGAKYGLGDTLVHEVGHWLMLHHTFNNGCSASGDFVADTPKEATPAFDCPVGRDTCAAEGLDPIRNFMDYTQDSCMVMFTRGQADRMSDAWLAFRDR